MPVTPTSYEAQVSTALVNMLAATAAFQLATGAADATAARAFIVEDDAGLAREGKCVDGSALDLTKCWAAVRVTECRTVDRAADTYGHEGDAQILLVVPPLANETKTEYLRRGRNLGGGVRDQLTAQFGQTVNGAPTPLGATITTPPPVISDETGPLQGQLLIPLDISYRDIP